LPITSAALGLIAYWAVQIAAFAIGALPGGLFGFELLIKLAASCLVLRAITRSVDMAAALRAQGLEVTAPAELAAARVRR
jgi:hypothetical protein